MKNQSSIGKVTKLTPHSLKNSKCFRGVLDNKVVVVTGGAGLLGAVFVRSIVEHGGVAVIADIADVSIEILFRVLRQRT